MVDRVEWSVAWLEAVENVTFSQAVGMVARATASPEFSLSIVRTFGAIFVGGVEKFRISADSGGDFRVVVWTIVDFSRLRSVMPLV